MLPKDDWIIDTGASDHMTESSTVFSSYTTCDEGIRVLVADGKVSTAMGQGTIMAADLSLNSILYVPDFRYNFCPLVNLQGILIVLSFFPFSLCFLGPVF